jgi:HEAT repeat protein
MRRFTPHERLVAQARDPRLTTSALLSQALEAVRQDRESDQDIHNPALLILQQRVTEEVFAAASALCTRPDPAERHLGVLILREFPGLGQHKPFAVRALSVLERLVERETDELVLSFGVCAIGWQQHPLARPLLLRFLHHPDSALRQIVANNLTNCDLTNPLPPESVRAYEHLCQDPDDDVRWYAHAKLQDLVEYEVPLPPTQKAALTRLLAGQ